MRILWIINSPLPEISIELKLESQAKGWISSLATALLEKKQDIELGVASFYNGKVLKEFQRDRIAHFLLPESLRFKLNKDNDSIWETVKKRFNPDVIHIHGSENFYSFSFIKECGAEKVVLSIQGLVSVYEKYYFGGISRMYMTKYTTLRDIVRFDTLFKQRRNMRKRGKYEKCLISLVDHVIGRTSWDLAHTWAINKNVQYHFCNETLRQSFYKKRWKLEECNKYSIFVSQAHYPIKGFHQMVKAMPLVLQKFPSTKVYVAGYNFFSNKGLKISGYGSYINSLIKRLNLSGVIEFTGYLSEEEICQQFLNSHVSVCPSAIENSPNSIGEAQLLGVPCISSYVGGIADMITHEVDGLLYRYEETEMLAQFICRIFSDNKFAQTLSSNGIKTGSKRHDKTNNVNELLKIYTRISESFE